MRLSPLLSVFPRMTRRSGKCYRSSLGGLTLSRRASHDHAGLRRCVFSLVALVVIGAQACCADVQPPAKYATAVEALERWLQQEVAAKQVPALSLALVDDQDIVWARGFGYCDADRKLQATADTPYRVGSVSKPFTALLLMLYAEMGLMDLDAPIQKYLPELRPHNTSGKEITLRQILAHRSGLVREPPVGNYFDDSLASLADTALSLNKTELIYTPETTTAYSNAALAVAGYVLEKSQKEPFGKLMRRKLLEPLGMNDSVFDATPQQRARLPLALMWTYHGREFPAPTWDFGMGPAGNLISTPSDQARLLQFLFAGGRGLIKRDTLERMWTIQYGKKDDTAGFGIGFFVSQFEGTKRIGHGGAVYGFATELAALPEEKLGVIVCSARDVSNGLTRRVADVSLRHLRAVRAGKPLPAIEQTQPIEPERGRALAGRYRAGAKELELYERGGRLWALPPRNGMKLELRRLGDELIVDDVMSFGTRIGVKGDDLVLGKDTYRRVKSDRPAPCPDKWSGLIGEYGPDFNTLYILEKNGVLHALIEWVFLYPLREVAENVFEFPDYGLYHGDKIVFTRGAGGQATHVDAANVRFQRRPQPRTGETFKIEPRRAVSELRREALAAQPTLETNVIHRSPELVELTSLEPSIRLDIRYAGNDNFLGTPFYTSPRAFLQRPAAEAVVRAHRSLTAHGYGLLIHDGYRPWHVTRMFWDATPDRFRNFVADPLKGSRHNRGCAVDLTLYELKSGKPVVMTGGYDEFSDRSYPDYLGGTSLERWQRDLLRRAMEDEDFTVYEAEWWHFDHRDWKRYPVLNLRFEELGQAEASIWADGAALKVEATGGGEGPAWHPELGILMSGNGNINQLDRQGKTHVYREKAGTNGLLFDAKGRLLACEPVRRRVTRTELDGSITVLTDNFEGKRYNQPNDLTLDSHGRLYFSDPRYGSRDDMQLRDAEGRTVEGVYRIDEGGKVTRVIGREVERANGVLVSADDRYLFVADNNNNARDGARKLWRFDLRADGSVDVASRKLLYDWGTGRGPDGLKQDRAGRLFVAGGLNKPQPPFEPAEDKKGGIYVLSQEGQLLAFLPVPRDEVTNCAFGGDDLRTLYITAGGTLYSIRTAQPGRVVWPK
jgi:CubicO group peptidase (beta-lactamase class C family)/D-alanyl-D-alanine dipeptidase/sugar lactone lactonase YvrE